MGRDKGRGNRPLPDLTIHPDPEPAYEPPPAHVTKSLDWSIPLTDDARLHVRIVTYKGRVVDFSINQLHIEPDGTEHEVARIDTTRGTIHRHQFVSSTGEDVYDHRLITTIPAKGWQVVDAGYHHALDVMHNEFEDNERRWRDG